ncbi:MAG TPA: peptidoglycan-binding domain-containing protein, partial [Reyranella sp.]|nr:peptidoglycan-binding domain-containing protein [Reyranella sp.]
TPPAPKEPRNGHGLSQLAARLARSERPRAKVSPAPPPSPPTPKEPRNGHGLSRLAARLALRSERPRARVSPAPPPPTPPTPEEPRNGHGLSRLAARVARSERPRAKVTPAPPPSPPAPKEPRDRRGLSRLAARLAWSKRPRAKVPPTTSPQSPSRPNEPRDRSLSRLASQRPALMWAGGLLVASLSVGVLAATWGGPARPPFKPLDQAKLERSRPTQVSDMLREATPPPVSTPALPKEMWRKDPPLAVQAPAPAQASDTPLSREEIRELQTRLKASGFDPGPIDGVVGARTTAAVQQYGTARALGTTEPSKPLLWRLRAEPTQSAEVRQR